MERGRGVSLGVGVGLGVPVAVGVGVARLGVGRGVGEHLPVHGVGVGVGVGVAVAVGVAVGVGVGPDCAQYLPPVLTNVGNPPPQTIIWLPVHTATCPSRAVGAPVVLVAVQLSVLALYRPPVFKSSPL